MQSASSAACNNGGGGDDLSPTGAPDTGFGIDFYQLDDDDVADLPQALIFTNVPPAVFARKTSANYDGGKARRDFEALFAGGGGTVVFEYFRSFRRVRAKFHSPQAATRARIKLDNARVGEFTVRCFYAQPDDDDLGFKLPSRGRLLELPALEKQFLISPPASPPVGWEQHEEQEPVDFTRAKAALPTFEGFELVAKLAAYARPDTVTELQPATDRTPGIVVHPSPDELLRADDEHEEIDEDGEHVGRGKIPHTPCPPRRVMQR